METLRDPQLVWRLQRYFGIRKVGLDKEIIFYKANKAVLNFKDVQFYIFSLFQFCEIYVKLRFSQKDTALLVSLI